MAKVNTWGFDQYPIDCDDLLIVVPDLDTCESPNNNLVTEIFYSNKPLVTGLLTEWNTRMSNTSTPAADVIRRLSCEGPIPRVDPVFKTTKKGASVPQKVQRILTYTIEDDADTTFDFYKKLQKGMTKYYWFRSGAHIYGGLQGIFGTLISDYEINDQSDLIAHNWRMQFRWDSETFPDRLPAVI